MHSVTKETKKKRYCMEYAKTSPNVTKRDTYKITTSRLQAEVSVESLIAACCEELLVHEGEVCIKPAHAQRERDTTRITQQRMNEDTSSR
jgi:hypothetical protein